MACGTPVVALRAGSVPEVVIDGLTGYICDRPEELPAAVQRVGALDPAACRRRVYDCFDLPDMVDGYEAVYRRALRQAARAVA
jgi:glycosyltransferase involved in cell wall biosynthesis